MTMAARRQDTAGRDAIREIGQVHRPAELDIHRRGRGAWRRGEGSICCDAVPLEPTFFKTPADFRAWLEDHHANVEELLVGFHKKKSGRPSMTWAEAVDQALCFGWIDGVRRSLDNDRYTIRFTPRKPRSNWSAVNIARAQKLVKERLMRPEGLAAFERRTEDRSAIYSYEQRKVAALEVAAEESFRANQTAWEFFQRQAPSYRRTAIFWVTSAKRDETRRRRLDTLIKDSAAGRRIKQLRPPAKT